MDPARLESLLLRDRRIIAAALALLVILAWAYLFGLAAGMEPVAGPLAPWRPADWLFMVLMWAVMMVGMMIPSAAPMILLFAGLRRKVQPQTDPGGETAAFLSGYLIVWIAFSIAATALQWGLERLALLSPMMVSASPVLSGLILVAAGFYQWLPVKESCLRHCRAPAQFIAAHWRPGRGGALKMGLGHGLYCLGCCWALMALLLVGGVMNLLWIALIAGVVLAEKLLPGGQLAGRLLGLLLAAAGLFVAFG